MAYDLSYTPGGETLRAFMLSDDFVRGIMGPVGSGKTACCCMELFRRASQMPPGPNGKRRSRWAVIRNTTPQLRTTTVKTWLDWFPEDVFGKMNWTPPFTHMIRVGDIELEVIFLALDEPKDVRKLLSLELTGIYVNEAREIQKAILDTATTRVGRFPSRRDVDAYWYGIIMDTNAPDAEHWWPVMAGDVAPPEWMTPDEVAAMVAPADWSFFAQPPAMVEERGPDGKVEGYALNPEAENLANLPPEYYPRLVQGKRRAWVNVYVLNRYDEVFDGQPVYPTFNRGVHVARERLMPVRNHTVWIGMDFGLTPAIVTGQHIRGRDFVQRELVGTNIGTNRFAGRILAFLAEHYPGDGWDFRFFGDPAGDERAQTDEQTPYDILRGHGIVMIRAPSNDPLVRLGAIENVLEKMVDGAPAYVVSPCCTTLIRGFEGGYAIDGKTKKPLKNGFSHPHDAEQYRMLGRGAGRAVRGAGQTQQPRRMQVDIRPTGFSRQSFVPRGLRGGLH